MQQVFQRPRSWEWDVHGLIPGRGRRLWGKFLCKWVQPRFVTADFFYFLFSKAEAAGPKFNFHMWTFHIWLKITTNSIEKRQVRRTRQEMVKVKGQIVKDLTEMKKFMILGLIFPTFLNMADHVIKHHLISIVHNHLVAIKSLKYFIPNFESHCHVFNRCIQAKIPANHMTTLNII